MKSLTLLTISLLFNAFSLLAQNTDEVNTLAAGYETLTESKSYLDFTASTSDFMKKAKHYSYEKSLMYESKFLENLEKRIGSTGFKDFDEAKSAYENLKQKYQTMKSENPVFFEQLKSSKPYSLADLMTPSITDTLEEKCKVCAQSYEGTLKSAAFNYESALRYKENSSVTAWMSLQNIKILLNDTYKLCTYGCK